VLCAVGLRRGGRERSFLVVYIIGIWVVRLRGRLGRIMLVHCQPQKVVQQLIQRGRHRLRRHRRGLQLAPLTGRHSLSPLLQPCLQHSSSCSSSFSTSRATLSAQSVHVQLFVATLPSSTRPQSTSGTSSSPTTLGHRVCDCWRGHGCGVIIGF
jgi:hypothetical protein